MANSIQNVNTYSSYFSFSSPVKLTVNQQRLFSRVALFAGNSFTGMKTTVSTVAFGAVKILTAGCYRIYHICKKNEIVHQKEIPHEQACLEAAEGCPVTYLSLHRDFGLYQIDDWREKAGLNIESFTILKDKLSQLGLKTVDDLKGNQIFNLEDLKNYLEFGLLLQELSNQELFGFKELSDWHYVGFEVKTKRELCDLLKDYGLPDIETFYRKNIFSKEDLKTHVEERFQTLWNFLTCPTLREFRKIDFESRIAAPIGNNLKSGIFSLEEWARMGIQASSFSDVKAKLQKIGVWHLDFCATHGIKTGIDLKAYIAQKKPGTGLGVLATP